MKCRCNLTSPLETQAKHGRGSAGDLGNYLVLDYTSLKL